MTYYLFINNVPNRNCVIIKYSSVENYIWRKMQLKFGKYASLATHTYSKAIRVYVNFFLPIILFASLWRPDPDLSKHI